MPKILDPESLSKDDAKQLVKFFHDQTQLGFHIWENNTDYHFEDGSLFQFPYLVIQRKRKTAEGVRYEFVSTDLIGEGGFGLVYDIVGTLVIEPDASSRFKRAGSHKDKARVVKKQQNDLMDVAREYAFINRFVPYLSVKEPVFQSGFSYSVMRKLKGRDLGYILQDDLVDNPRLTFQQRFDLTHALLQALKEQVGDKGIIHCDIKPDNILVDLTQKSIKVHIIDFGLSVCVDDSDVLLGVTHFSAPEIFRKEKLTAKADVFSMGRILALLWDIDLTSYDPIYTDWQLYINAKNINLDSLFARLPEVSDENVRHVIKEMLQGMMSEKLAQRFSIDQCIAALKVLPSPLSLDAAPAKESKLAPFAFFNKGEPVSEAKLKKSLLTSYSSI